MIIYTILKLKLSKKSIYIISVDKQFNNFTATFRPLQSFPVFQFNNKQIILHDHLSPLPCKTSNIIESSYERFPLSHR